jgi:hypothetical protein
MLQRTIRDRCIEATEPEKNDILIGTLRDDLGAAARAKTPEFTR